MLSSPHSVPTESSLPVLQDGNGASAFARSSPATLDSNNWWSQVNPDSRTAHTLSTFPQFGQTPAPARQFNHPATQSQHTTHHNLKPQQNQYQAWSMLPATAGNQDPLAGQDFAHRAQSFRPGSRHMSDPGLDSSVMPGSNSTPGGRSTSSASAGTMHDAFVTQARDHLHNDSWPRHPTRPRGPHLSQQVQAQRNNLGALWERSQPKQEAQQGIDQMLCSPEVQVRCVS